MKKIKNNNLTEIQEIKNTVHDFYNGIFEHDYDKICSFFYSEGKSMGYSSRRKEIGIVSRNHWKEMFENNPIDPNQRYHFEIANIEYFKTAATVQIDIWEEFDETRMEYRDFLSLLKLESKWLIVNKVFHSNTMQINKTAVKQNGETEMKHKQTDDIDLIIKTVQYYIDAVTNIELSKVKKAWHTNGQRIFVDKKSNEIVFLESPVKDDVKKIESALKNTKQRCMIESINKSGTSATARIKWFVESPDWVGTEINFLSLLKREDKWEIVGKIAHKD
ncbi:MAG: hypothetical protein HGN29_08820 [Asgard group archaeon]|nr:hypothetical protein [Asgard group archaeon]